jgi:aspartyl protease family protein
MSRRLTFTLLFGVLLSFTAITASTEQDAIGQLLRHDMGAVALKASLVICATGLLIALFRENLSKALENALFCSLLLLVGFVAYSYRYELKSAGERVMAVTFTGWFGRDVEVKRGTRGDFGVTARINGARVAMVLDTGATSVVLTQDAARAAGLPLEVLAYTVPVDTANGRTQAAPVTLDKLAVGGLTERQVPALVVKSGQLHANLLGMTFLNRLESWEVRGDKLKLRGSP